MEDNELFKDIDSKGLDKIVQKIVNLRSEKGKLLIDKYDVKWLISEFEGEKITYIEKRFNRFNSQGLDIIDFCTAFLQEVKH